MNNKEYLQLCESFLKKKEACDNFEKVEKKEFYNKIGKAFKENEDSLQFSDGKAKNIIVTKVVKFKTEYDIPKLKDRVDKEVYNKFLVRELKVVNTEGLIQFFKDKNIDFKDIKNLIEINYKVDEKKLEEQLQIGGVTTKDVSSCSKTQCSEPYFLVKRLDNEKK